MKDYIQFKLILEMENVERRNLPIDQCMSVRAFFLVRWKESIRVMKVVFSPCFSILNSKRVFLSLKKIKNLQ